jgi:hypothetical protein
MRPLQIRRLRREGIRAEGMPSRSPLSEAQDLSRGLAIHQRDDQAGLLSGAMLTRCGA